MKKLLIFPYNGNGIEAIDCIGNEYELIGFIDDTPQKQGEGIGGYRVYSREVVNKYTEAYVLSVPGSSVTYLNRYEIIEGLNIEEKRFARVIHPSAHISPLSVIGYNVLIMAGSVVTANGIIGNHVCILPNTVIHHDVEIGDLTLIGSNVTVAGYTRIGSNCYIGSGSKIINNIEIGDGCLIGLGSNVIRALAPYSKAAGNPAKVIGTVK